MGAHSAGISLLLCPSPGLGLTRWPPQDHGFRAAHWSPGHTLTLIDGGQGVPQHKEPALFAQHLGYQQEAGAADVRGGPPAHGSQACQERPAGSEAGRGCPRPPAGLARHRRRLLSRTITLLPLPRLRALIGLRGHSSVHLSNSPVRSWAALQTRRRPGGGGGRASLTDCVRAVFWKGANTRHFQAGFPRTPRC